MGNLLLFFFAYFIYKYSIHFFAFLEATVAEGRSLAFAIKQCGRDIINSGSLLLRVVVLVIRLNIYDGVDDVLDSYYIFVADFDDDEYFNDLGFFISPRVFSAQAEAAVFAAVFSAAHEFQVAMAGAALNSSPFTAARICSTMSVSVCRRPCARSSEVA